MYSFIPKVEEILSQHEISYSGEFDPEHLTINTDDRMVDPGFSMDNKVLDLYIDVDHKILFIGLLRLPCQNRRKKIGSKIIQQIIDWAERHDYTLFLDSSGDSYTFWSKCGFSLIEKKYGFDIMGFGEDQSFLKDKWKDGQQLFTQTH